MLLQNFPMEVMAMLCGRAVLIFLYYLRRSLFGAFPDLPAGDYVIKVDGTPFAAKAKIEEGKLTFVDLGGLG